MKPYLTEEQVNKLNEKYGWFAFGDAQSDVSRAFAQDAIARHEAIRQAAPDLLEALQNLVAYADGFNVSGVYMDEEPEGKKAIRDAYVAIELAIGE